MKPTHFVAALGPGLGFPRFGRTAEEGWINLIEKPDVCRKLGELACRRSFRTLRAYAALGFDGVIPCGDLGSSHGLDARPEVYRDLVYPWQKLQGETAHALGLKFLLHCCGHVMPIIDEIAEIYDAYEAIQTSAGMDIRVLKERVGDRITLWGGVMHEHLNGGTVEDIRSDMRYTIEHAAPGGGFILGSSHSLAVGARIENVMEMKRCRDEWGVYGK
jgi:uroporphyrinogen decarboxylase